MVRAPGGVNPRCYDVYRVARHNEKTVEVQSLQWAWLSNQLAIQIPELIRSYGGVC